MQPDLIPFVLPLAFLAVCRAGWRGFTRPTQVGRRRAEGGRRPLNRPLPLGTAQRFAGVAADVAEFGKRDFFQASAAFV